MHLRSSAHTKLRPLDFSQAGSSTPAHALIPLPSGREQQVVRLHNRPVPRALPLQRRRTRLWRCGGGAQERVRVDAAHAERARAGCRAERQRGVLLPNEI